MNINPFSYGQIQNSPLRIVQTNSLFEPSIQIPLIQKKNNNKNNKNLSLNKNIIQNEKNEDNDDESDINECNENNTFNNPSKKKTMENIPQLINSFYFLNENIKKNNQSNDISINNNEENKNINNDNNIINNLKNNKIKEKTKHKKHNYIFNKSLLQILENFDLTNEEKILYILDNFKNIKFDPLILKVLEYRKINRKNGLNENNNINIVNGKQNATSLKSGLNKKNGLNNDSNYNNLNSSLNNENNSYIPPQPVKPSFPMDDKILFKNLGKYKISLDILDRPSPIKIDLDYNILNKLFIIWDFLITFKDIVFTEKIYDFEINKNILTFYSNLLDEKNNYQYYKSVFISLLLLCVKNIPIVVPSPKEPRLFLLKSILDNLHSISYNIIYDSPLVVLKEITDCYLYRNLIEENNLKILKNVLENANNIKNKENFENKKEFNKEDDNINKIDNNTKIYLLHIIIGLCFETILIKEKIKNEYDNMNSLSYTKKGLDESLFDTEKRMKELNRMENFKTLSKDIENLEKQLSELKLKENNKMEIEKEEKDEKNEKNEENLKKDEIKVDDKNEKENNKNDIDNINKKKEIKELEIQIDRYKSILIENDKLIERKKEINNKINEIIESIYNLKTLRKKYLGIDYQNNEYYYFISVPNKIYTKNKKRKEWGYFENKDDIQKLINKLTDKGKNEKKLKFFLKFILSQMKEKEEKEKEKEKKDNEEIKDKNDNTTNNDNDNDKDKDKEINNNPVIINEIENEQNKDEKENKAFKKPTEIQIKIENIQKNINDEENINKKNVHNINLGVSFKKNKNKQKEQKEEKEEIKIDNIHIMEDDEPEEIEEDKEEIEENDDNEEIISQTKNKININTIKIQNDDKTNKISLVPPKKELFTFIISEDRLHLNIILMKIDDVFSEYLVQFNKQWESEINRSTWKKIIANNPTDKNILTTLKMFNHKFKNPYKILSIEEEQELIIKEKINKGNNFNFDEENGNIFSISETNNLLLLSPKVKIWSKEMDLIDIDNYYNNDLLVNVYSREQLCYVVHFYEMAIFGLVHRREGKRKL